MAKHQHFDYKQSVIEPIFLEDQLVPGTLEHTIHYIVEDRLNMSAFDARYNNDVTGRKSIVPKLLLKIVLYGYSRGMVSSRSLEYACQKITTFMALACNKTPDHSTIAAFVSSINEEIEDLFTMVLMICHEEGLLGGTHFSIDGLKLSSNASKEMFVSKMLIVTDDQRISGIRDINQKSAILMLPTLRLIKKQAS